MRAFRGALGVPLGGLQRVARPRAFVHLLAPVRAEQESDAVGRPHLLVLDRGLPAIDGLDLLVRLRANGILTAVLVLSALGHPGDG